MHSYLAYGSVIRTALDLSRVLPSGQEGRFELSVVDSAGTVPATIVPNRIPMFRSHECELVLLTDGPLETKVSGRPFCFEVQDVARFFWQGGTFEVRMERLERGTEDLLAFWLIHLFLPLYFTLEGHYNFIHACAVDLEGETILFTGPSHSGKSTLTNFFIERGHILVSDDKVATFEEHDTWQAVPSHPNHRPYRRFADLGLRVQEYCPQIRPLSAIYALCRAAPEAGVRVREMQGHRKFVNLLPNALFNFDCFRAQRLRYLGRLLNAVPFYRVDVPWDLDRLAEVHDALIAHRQTGELKAGA